MRDPQKWFGITADLMINDDVSNIIHEFRHDLNVVVVFRVTRGLDTTQHFPKLVLDPIEGAGRGLVQGLFRRSKGN